MDSRIEEFALAIHERAKTALDHVMGACGGAPMSDKHQYWRAIVSHAKGVLDAVEGYRRTHPEEYEDIALSRAQARVKELQSDVVSLRSELSRYREREKTMGWSQE
jgi:hypothetical protein